MHVKRCVLSYICSCDISRLRPTGVQRHLTIHIEGERKQSSKRCFQRNISYYYVHMYISALMRNAIMFEFTTFTFQPFFVQWGDFTFVTEEFGNPIMTGLAHHAFQHGLCLWSKSLMDSVCSQSL